MRIRTLLILLLLLSVVGNLAVVPRLYRQRQRDQLTTTQLKQAIETSDRVIRLNTGVAGQFSGVLEQLAAVQGRVQATEYRWPRVQGDCLQALIGATTYAAMISGMESPVRAEYAAPFRGHIEALKACAGD